MRWLIDSDVLIEGERENPAFLPWLESQDEVATADIVRGEFLLGVYAIGDAAKRQRGELFYRNRIRGLASLSCEVADYEAAARMAGEARRQQRQRVADSHQAAGGDAGDHGPGAANGKDILDPDTEHAGAGPILAGRYHLIERVKEVLVAFTRDV